MGDITLDEIGKWSETKRAIIREYVKAYSKVRAQQAHFNHIYIDGFAGAGMRLPKATQEKIAGSPLDAVAVEPGFREYHLVERDQAKALYLRRLFASNKDVSVHGGDCNDIVQNKLLPTIRYDQHRRALCLLDPYTLDLDWSVIQAAGKLQTVDLLLYFPMMDMNMNALWHNPETVQADQASRLTRYWGNGNWKRAAYASKPRLSDAVPVEAGDEPVARDFVARLKSVAGFNCVGPPLPMRNSANAVVYYLFFASVNNTSDKIMRGIFRKYRT